MKHEQLSEQLLDAAEKAPAWIRCQLNGRRGTYTVYLEETAEVERANLADGMDGGSITVPIRDYIALANPDNIRSLIEGYREQLKTVLYREAASQKRHDDKLDELEAKTTQARKEALEEAATLADRLELYKGVTVAREIRALIAKEPAKPQGEK